jgi:membrane protein required for colicin V production
MNIADYIAIAVIMLMAIRIAFKGFIVEFTSKSALFVGLSVALMFSAPVTQYAPTQATDLFGRWMEVAAFMMMFILGWVMMKIFLVVLVDIVDVAHLELFDTVLGFALGAIEGAVIVSLIVYLLQFQQTFDFTTILSHSRFIHTIEPLAPGLSNAVKTQLIDKIIHGGS